MPPTRRRPAKTAAFLWPRKKFLSVSSLSSLEKLRLAGNKNCIPLFSPRRGGGRPQRLPKTFQLFARHNK
jgi:hypothetical protein